MRILKIVFLIGIIDFLAIYSVTIYQLRVTRPKTELKATPTETMIKPSQQIVNATAKPTLVVAKIVPTPTATPTTAGNQSGGQATPDNRCIITIDGQKYDVTDFRNQHPGGDIFNCGTDMSAIFHGQHSNSTLRKMQRYLI